MTDKEINEYFDKLLSGMIGEDDWEQSRPIFPKQCKMSKKIIIPGTKAYKKKLYFLNDARYVWITEAQYMFLLLQNKDKDKENYNDIR